MLSLVRLLFSELYCHLRGPVSVHTEISRSVYREKHPSDDSLEGLRQPTRFVFKCYEQSHVIHYKRWYMRDRTIYTYIVDGSVEGIGDKKQHLPRKVYPMLSRHLLPENHLPQQMAIRAAIEELHLVVSRFINP